MSEENDKKCDLPPAAQQPNEAKKVGFLGRFFQRLDQSMKVKADNEAKKGSCCSGNDKPGGKCC